MSIKFERKNSIRDMEILGEKFEVDFSRDEIAIVLAEVSDNMTNIEKGLDIEEGTIKRATTEILEKLKEEARRGINIILNDDTACERIFKDNNSMALHEEVYDFLVTQYSKYKEKRFEKYAPNRAQRRK
ncbi:hypothetical protein NYU56_18460 (plasmid) [Clostridioides difficile]|uniref:hypothetical protein n=1 Tax=Clostridioides difficile TaxID=1496 RepID=UPI0021C87E98|nr:hypothetical protein [Clostridioides difficile]UWD43268.1 hypothetical protein NYF05_19415 [Clostridioides difficile]UWD46789.1 hypothetical protein NYU56_18460 [Clostridioides difficile]UWD50695.1 hypothetical protein NYR90_20060 [Clostridioides phage Hain-Saunders-2022a]